MIDRFQSIGRADRKRRPAIFRSDIRTHFAQRLDNAVHRPFLKRFVAGQYRAEALPGEQTSEQAHCRPAVSAIKRFGRLAKTLFTHSMNHNCGACLLDRNPELPQASNRRSTILAIRKILDRRSTFGDRADHRRAVRYRLIAGKANASAYRICGLYQHNFDSSLNGPALS